VDISERRKEQQSQETLLYNKHVIVNTIPRIVMATGPIGQPQFLYTHIGTPTYPHTT
jgi:hypothetical protein